MSTSSRANSKPFAIAVVVGSVATLGYMFIAGKQTKAEEGPASIYKSKEQGGGLLSGTTDARMDSAAVRQTVSGQRKP
ncbi:hypothetical protein ABKN59_011727 [Abortiporus biennis]